MAFYNSLYLYNKCICNREEDAKKTAQSYPHKRKKTGKNLG